MTDAAFSYYGGKSAMAPLISSMLPRHSIYVEVFGGSGAVLCHKTPSELEIYNDVDSSLVNFYRVLRQRPDDLIAALELTPYSREEHGYSYDHIDDPILDPVERARIFFVLVDQSFSSKMTSKTWGVTRSINHAKSTINSVAGLIDVAERLRRVVIEHYTFEKIFKMYDTADTCFYVDPPYVPSTRIKDKVYRNEMGRSQHETLLNLATSCKGKVIISGYASEMYDSKLKGWKREVIKQLANSKGKTRAIVGSDEKARTSEDVREEVLWIKPGSEIQKSIWDLDSRVEAPVPYVENSPWDQDDSDFVEGPIGGV